MKRSITIALTFFMMTFMNNIYGQLDTIHYIPPMSTPSTNGGVIGWPGGGGGGNNYLVKKHYLYLSTPSQNPIQVTIKRGDNTVLDVVTVQNGQPYTYYVGNGINTPLFVNKNNLNTVKQNKGIICESTEPFYVSYRVNGAASTNVQHADWATGKGNHGLGTEFRVGGMPCFNAGTNNGHPRSITVGVMATQDNTTITYSDYDLNIKFFGNPGYTPPPTFSITLQAGETYTVCLKQTAALTANYVGVIGSLITSNKPIAVINGNLTGSIHPTNTNNQDFGFDISIPTNELGQDYILVEGHGGPDMEKPMVIAHTDNTEIYVNDNPVAIATLMAGDYYLIDNSHYQGTNHRNMYVHTSEPAYMYQMIAATDPGEKDGGMVLVPEISCFLPSSIDEIPEVEKIGTETYNTGYTVTTEVGSTVLINNTPIGVTPEPVLGTPWETYKIDSMVTGHLEVVSSSAVAVSVYGAEAPSGFAGYYSGFIGDPDTSDFVVTDFCTAYNTNFASWYDPDFPADSVTWDFGDGNIATGDTVDHIYTLDGTYDVEMIVHRCKNDTVTQTITINPSYDIVANPVVCEGTVYTLPSGATVTTTGVYVENFMTSLGCDSIITTDLTVNPVDTLNQNIFLCYGGSYTLPGGTTVTTSGIYQDVLTSAMGCDSVIITDLVIEQEITAAVTAEICDGESYLLPGGNNVTVSGIYVDVLTAASGCDSTVTTDLTVKPLPQIDAGIDLDVCPGDSVTVVAHNPDGAIISWNNGITDGNPFEVNLGQTITVTAELNGCFSYDDITITVLAIPEAEFTYSQDEPQANGTFVQFYVQEGYNSDWTYFWNFGDGSYSDEYGPDHIFEDGDIEQYGVTLIVTNELGCSDEASVTIELEKPIIYYVPNAFTPNGDDYNNTFQPVFTSGHDPYDFHMTIFNRWGEIVFESYNAQEGWDGSYGDQLVDDGVYVWAIEFGELNTDKMHKEQGHITVLR